MLITIIKALALHGVQQKRDVMKVNAGQLQRTTLSWFWLLLLCLFAFGGNAYAAKGPGAGGAAAGGGGGVFPVNPLLPPPIVPPQFDILGFIQEATLDTTGAVCAASNPRLQGGTVKVNGITVIIPCNTILQMPAATMTWQDLFALAPRDMGLPLGADGIPTQTGMAQNDTVNIPLAAAHSNSPLPSYEIQVQGNVVNGRYIAGLVFISQQSLNSGQGVISAIDYDKAEFQVTISGPTPSTVRVRINDPGGRFGKKHGAAGSGSNPDVIEPYYDVRFSVDDESPTIQAATGYPMCLPRSGQGDDPECPEANRPTAPNCLSLPAPFPPFTMPATGDYCMTYMMPPPGTVGGPDPSKQAPFEVGDTITFLGNLKYDENGAYVSAHTVGANVGIYTSPGVMPAYVAVEVLIQGTSSQPLPNLPQEATSRVKVEGMSTDPTRLVDIFAVDVDPQSGAESERWLGTANPSGPPVIGRFRFLPSAGAYLPPTREMRVVSRTMCGDKGNICTFAGQDQLYANGLMAGQYHAPIFEFLFAENLVLGDATVSANLQDLPFLYCGSGPLEGNGPAVHQLDPAPWAAPMPTPSFAATLCSGAPAVGAVAVTAPAAPPTITVFPSNAITVNASASVFLSASATDASGLPIAIVWTQVFGLPTQGMPQIPPSQPNAITFTAPWNQGKMVFTATATNPVTGKSSNANITIDVNAAIADSLSDVKATWTNSIQNRGALNVVAVSNVPLDENGLPPVGLQLFVQASANVASVVPNGNGGTTVSNSVVQLAATPLPMFFAETGPLNACPVGVARCWQFTTRGALVDPNGKGTFIPPDEITITSTFGGTAKATLNNGGILLR